MRMLHGLMLWNASALVIVPVLADVFVFFYPVFLLALYLYGMYRKNNHYKREALWILIVSWVTIVLNIVIQFFVSKSRPNVVLGLENAAEPETLLHKFLPSSSFPSDHAALSMWFAVACLLCYAKSKKPRYLRAGIFFLAWSIVMSGARIAVGVHRPTDILAGFCVGIIVAFVCSKKRIFAFFDRKIISPIIVFEEKIYAFFVKK